MSEKIYDVLISASEAVSIGATTQGASTFILSVSQAVSGLLRKTTEATYYVRGRYTRESLDKECPNCRTDGIGKGKVIINSPDDWFHCEVAACDICKP